MSDSKTKECQKILSIEEYKKKRMRASAVTASGDMPQTSAEKETDSTASILAFTQKNISDSQYPKESQEVSPLKSKGKIIYMTSYKKPSAGTALEASDAPGAGGGQVFFDEDISPSENRTIGNVIVMNEYFKRKTLNHRPTERDWEKDLLPHTLPPAFQKWTAAAAVAILVAVASPFFDKKTPSQRGLANVEESGRKPDTKDLFENKHRAHRTPQSLIERSAFNKTSLKNAITIREIGRKPTQSEQLKGY